MKRIMIMSSFFMICLLSLPASAGQGLAIIVNPENNSQLDLLELRRIFLGKSRAFPDGTEAVPLNQAPGSSIRIEFASKVLKKNEGNLNAYWARMLFSSRAAPPKEIDSAKEIKQMVSKDLHLISYINTDDVDDSVRVLMIIP